MTMSSGRSRTRFALAAILALGCTAGWPAAMQAQVRFSDLDKSMDAMTMGRADNAVLPNQKAVRANIDTRISQMRAQISIGLSRGWLKPRQAAALGEQLDMVQSMQTRARQVGLTTAEAQDLIGRLHTVSANLSDQLASNGKIQQEHITSLTNLENQRLYLQSRIDQGLRLGSLSPDEVRDLRREVAEIRAEENNHKGLTQADQERLHRRMSALDAKINGYW